MCNCDVPILKTISRTEDSGDFLFSTQHKINES